MPNQSKKPKPKDQIKGFKEAARALECDQSEAAFDKALKKIGKASAKENKPRP